MSYKDVVDSVPCGCQDGLNVQHCYDRSAWNATAIEGTGELRKGIELSKRLQRAILRYIFHMLISTHADSSHCMLSLKPESNWLCALQ